MDINRPHNTIAAETRQRQIEDCMFESMMGTPFSEISVSEICKKLNIARRTFYAYFADKDACLISLMDRMVWESMKRFPNGIMERPDKTEAIIAYLSYWKEHRDFLEVLISQNLRGLMVDRFFLYFKTHSAGILEYMNTPEVRADEDALWVYSAVRFAILRQWHASGYALPVEEMAIRYIRFLNRPIIQDIP